MQSFAARLAERRGTSRSDENAGLMVIGAGFGRTGTMSLKVALEQLGLGRCYHMTELVKNPSHPELWAAAGRGEPVDWHRLYRRYRATVDWPGCLFYRELAASFPQAKVVLTVRDPDRWYDSVLSTLFSLKTATDDYLASQADADRPVIFYDSRIWDEVFGGRFAERAHAIEVFQRHNAEVRASLPADRLLVYQVSEGWPPLCEFLQLPVPETGFPHLNDRQAFRDYNRDLLRPGRDH